MLLRVEFAMGIRIRIIGGLSDPDKNWFHKKFRPNRVFIDAVQ